MDAKRYIFLSFFSTGFELLYVNDFILLLIYLKVKHLIFFPRFLNLMIQYLTFTSYLLKKEKGGMSVHTWKKVYCTICFTFSERNKYNEEVECLFWVLSTLLIIQSQDFLPCTLEFWILQSKSKICKCHGK